MNKIRYKILNFILLNISLYNTNISYSNNNEQNNNLLFMHRRINSNSSSKSDSRSNSNSAQNNSFSFGNFNNNSNSSGGNSNSSSSFRPQIVNDRMNQENQIHHDNDVNNISSINSNNESFNCNDNEDIQPIVNNLSGNNDTMQFSNDNNNNIINYSVVNNSQENVLNNNININSSNNSSDSSNSSSRNSSSNNSSSSSNSSSGGNSNSSSSFRPKKVYNTTQLQICDNTSFTISNNTENQVQNNNTEQYHVTYELTCNIKYDKNVEQNWKLESDKFNNNDFNDSIHVKLNINGSDNNYKDINVPYIKYDNFLTVDKGKQVHLVDNEPVETNNGTYRFVTNKNNLYLLKVTDSSRAALEQAIKDNGGYIDDDMLMQILSRYPQNNDDSQNQNNEESSLGNGGGLMGFAGFGSGNKNDNSENKQDNNNENDNNGNNNTNKINNDESTENNNILNNSNHIDLNLIAIESISNGEDNSNSVKDDHDNKRIIQKLMKDPGSTLSTYFANLKSIQNSDINLISQLFSDDFMYIFAPFNASKKKYWIKGSLYGLNNDNWNSNSVFLGGDIFNDPILDCKSYLKLQLIGGTSIGKLTNNNNKYKTVEFTIGPKLSLLHKNFMFELLGLYKYSTVSYIGDQTNKFVNNGFTIGSKLGINLNLSNVFVLQPYLKILYSYIESHKPIKKLLPKYQLTLVPGIALGIKLRNNVSVIAYYQHYCKSILSDKTGIDLTDNSLNYINEFGIGINKICNNSIEIGTKLAVDIINRTKKCKKQNDSSVKLQAEISKLL